MIWDLDQGKDLAWILRKNRRFSRYCQHAEGQEGETEPCLPLPAIANCCEAKATPAVKRESLGRRRSTDIEPIGYRIVQPPANHRVVGRSEDRTAIARRMQDGGDAQHESDSQRLRVQREIGESLFKYRAAARLTRHRRCT